MREALLLSLIVACVSFTVSEAVIFSGLRAALKKRNQRAGKLLSCGYCLSHWVAAVIVAFCRPQMFSEYGLWGYGMSWLAITWLAAWQWALLASVLKYLDK